MGPKFGDVLIKETPDGRCEVVDALAPAHVSNDFATLDAALVVARMKGARVWQQRVDYRGRPLGDPILLSPSVASQG